MVTKSDGTDARDTNVETGSENCRHDGAHILDLSKKSITTYNCPSCGSKQIGVSTHGTDYSYYLHFHSGSGYISGFQDKVTEQTGITFTGITSNVFVYRYPNRPEGIPLLIYLLGSRWFKRTSPESNTWTEVSQGKPDGPTNDPEILELLKDILPTVTINVGQTNVNNGKHTYYDDPSEGGEQKQVKVKREDLEHGSYVGLSHSLEKKEGFIVKEIKHNGKTLQGIPQNLVVKNVKAYYYKGRSNFTLKNLLLVGFGKRGTDQNNYAYYGKKDGGSNWTPLHDQTGKLDDTEFIKSLLR